MTAAVTPGLPGEPAKRRRGAPKNNLNALKHGAGSTRLALRNLAGAAPEELDRILAVLRANLRGLLAESPAPDHPAVQAERRRLLTLAAGSFCRVAWARRGLGPLPAPVRKAAVLALVAVLADPARSARLFPASKPPAPEG